jgi:hypothetical protein
VVQQVLEIGHGIGRGAQLQVRRACMRMESETGGLAARQKLLREFDAQGIMATPANSGYNEQVIEAARESILNGGREVKIE